MAWDGERSSEIWDIGRIERYVGWVLVGILRSFGKRDVELGILPVMAILIVCWGGGCLATRFKIKA